MNIHIDTVTSRASRALRKAFLVGLCLLPLLALSAHFRHHRCVLDKVECFALPNITKIRAPRIRPQILDLLGQRLVFQRAHSHRIQMHVARQRQKILVPLHQLRLVPAVQ